MSNGTIRSVIVRDGGSLIVPRDADFSPLCFQCAQPSAGAPIVKFLRVDKSVVFHKPIGPGVGGNFLFWLDILEFLIWSIWWVADWPKSRHRRIRFGLCATHRKRRRWLRLAMHIGLPSGVVLVIFGIFGDIPDWMHTVAIASGMALTTGGGIAAGYVNDPRLVGENRELLWIKGAGREFLDQQPERPH
jgi:hypothetical protein